MDRRRVDFDAARKERNLVPLEVLVGGEVYLLPASLPAALAMEIVDLKHIQDEAAARKPALSKKEQQELNTLSFEKLLELGGELFGGRDAMMELSKKHALGIDELGELLNQVFDAYNTEVLSPNVGSPKVNRAQRRRRPAKRRASGS